MCLHVASNVNRICVCVPCQYIYIYLSLPHLCCLTMTSEMLRSSLSLSHICSCMCNQDIGVFLPCQSISLPHLCCLTLTSAMFRSSLSLSVLGLLPESVCVSFCGRVPLVQVLCVEDVTQIYDLTDFFTDSPDKCIKPSKATMLPCCLQEVKAPGDLAAVRPLSSA